MMTSTALVLLMIPGVGFFYSGLARRKSALSLIWLSMMSTAVVSFQVRTHSSPHSNLLTLLAVVLLGVFTLIFPHSDPFSWKPRQHRSSQCFGTGLCREFKDTRPLVCRLPGNVLMHHVCWVFLLSLSFG